LAVASDAEKQFLTFFHQRLDQILFGQFSVYQQLEPEERFIGFFHNDADLGNEISSGARPTGSSIISSERSSRTEKLPTDYANGFVLWQSRKCLDDANCERLRSVLQQVRFIECAHSQSLNA